MAQLSRDEIQKRLRNIRSVLGHYASNGYKLAGYAIHCVDYEEKPGLITVKGNNFNIKYNALITIDSTLKSLGVRKVAFKNAMDLKKYLKECIVNDLKKKYPDAKIHIRVGKTIQWD